MEQESVSGFTRTAMWPDDTMTMSSWVRWTPSGCCCVALTCHRDLGASVGGSAVFVDMNGNPTSLGEVIAEGDEDEATADALSAAGSLMEQHLAAKPPGP